MRRTARLAPIAIVTWLLVSWGSAGAVTPRWRAHWKTLPFAAAPGAVQRDLVRGWASCGFSPAEVARYALVDAYPSERGRVYESSISADMWTFDWEHKPHPYQGLCAANALISWVWFPTREGSYRMFQTRDGGLFRGPRGYIVTDNDCPYPHGNWRDWAGKRRILIWSTKAQRFQQITRCMSDEQWGAWLDARRFRYR